MPTEPEPTVDSHPTGPFTPHTATEDGDTPGEPGRAAHG